MMIICASILAVIHIQAIMARDLIKTSKVSTLAPGGHTGTGRQTRETKKCNKKQAL